MKTEDKNYLTLASALVAISTSIFALYMSCSARDDVRALGHLDLKPSLTLRTSFKNEHNPTHFRITNNGPITATQVKIVGRVLRYFEENRKVQMESAISDLEWVIGDLKPLEDTAIVFNESFLTVFFDPGIKPEHHIFALRLFYRRPSDMMLYVEQAYYFVSPEGKWVNEVSSLNDSIYAPIKKAAMAWPPSNMPLEYQIGDPLHPIDPDDHFSWGRD